jgi:hypothetical protein
MDTFKELANIKTMEDLSLLSDALEGMDLSEFKDLRVC